VIIEIEGADDPRLEPYRHVGDHHWLRSHGLFVAEGRLVVERLIAAVSFQLHSVLSSPTALAAMRGPLGAVDAPIYVAAKARVNEITGFNFHRGCLALARRPQPLGLDALPDARLLLGLEGIGNPDNVGGLFRTAAAFGIGAILLDDATGDPFYRKAVRTSMGSTLVLPFATVSGWLSVFAALRERDVTIAALTPQLPATGVDDFAAQIGGAKAVLVMVGAEGAGLSQEVLEAADARVRIPTVGDVDSLNVTVAAGVALARLARLR
jgi:tRNA G18 (ribose-2'-O)-methylase SpoU